MRPRKRSRPRTDATPIVERMGHMMMILLLGLFRWPPTASRSGKEFHFVYYNLSVNLNRVHELNFAD